MTRPTKTDVDKALDFLSEYHGSFREQLLAAEVIALREALANTQPKANQLRQELADTRGKLTCYPTSAVDALIIAWRNWEDGGADPGELLNLRGHLANVGAYWNMRENGMLPPTSGEPRYSTEAVDALLKEILWGTRGQGRADGLRHLAEAVRASREPKL